MLGSEPRRILRYFVWNSLRLGLCPLYTRARTRGDRLENELRTVLDYLNSKRLRWGEMLGVSEPGKKVKHVSSSAPPGSQLGKRTTNAWTPVGTLRLAFGALMSVSNSNRCRPTRRPLDAMSLVATCGKWWQDQLLKQLMDGSSALPSST